MQHTQNIQPAQRTSAHEAMSACMGASVHNSNNDKNNNNHDNARVYDITTTIITIMIIMQEDSGRHSQPCARSSLSSSQATPGASYCGICPCRPFPGSRWRPGPGVTSSRIQTCGNCFALWRGLVAKDPRWARTGVHGGRCTCTDRGPERTAYTLSNGPHSAMAATRGEA